MATSARSREHLSEAVLEELPSRPPCRRGGTGSRPVPRPWARASWRSRSGMDIAQRPAQPDVEEVGQVRVADVVVVRRIGADDDVRRTSRVAASACSTAAVPLPGSDLRSLRHVHSTELDTSPAALGERDSPQRSPMPSGSPAGEEVACLVLCGSIPGDDASCRCRSSRLTPSPGRSRPRRRSRLEPPSATTRSRGLGDEVTEGRQRHQLTSW